MLKTPYFYLFFNDVDSEYDYYNSDGDSDDYSLREKFPNTDLFLVFIFLYSG